MMARIKTRTTFNMKVVVKLMTKLSFKKKMKTLIKCLSSLGPRWCSRKIRRWSRIMNCLRNMIRISRRNYKSLLYPSKHMEIVLSQTKIFTVYLLLALRLAVRNCCRYRLVIKWALRIKPRTKRKRLDSQFLCSGH